MTTNPCTTAAEVAKLLDSDPIMASQIKEYLSHERIHELLELEPELTDRALIDLVRKRKLVSACLEHAENSDLLEEIRNRL
jgi:hypothetical protein